MTDLFDVFMKKISEAHSGTELAKYFVDASAMLGVKKLPMIQDAYLKRVNFLSKNCQKFLK